MPSRLQISRLTYFLAALVLAALTPCLTAQSSLPKRVVGDYVYWSKYQDPPYSAAQIPYRKLTHINHGGISFDAYGSLTVPQGFIEPELNNSAHAAGVKVMLLIGGNFAGLEATGAVQTLVDNIAAAEKQYAYDGVDIDWEYPETTADRTLLVTLMAKLRQANPNYTLSLDAAPWGGYGYDLAHLRLSVDYVNIMMYDCAGPWTAHAQLNSAIFWDPHNPAPDECQPGGSVHDTADIFLQGMPAQQLNMGTPFYGYYYTNVKRIFGLCPNSNWTADGYCDNAVSTAGYGLTLKPLINQQGWRTHYDPVAMVPFMLREDGSDGYITYDDPSSTYLRVWYSDWQRRLGGTFLWSLDEDYDGHSQDLLDAMYHATLDGAR